MARTLPFIHAAEELADALTERLAPALAAAELTAAHFSVLYMLAEDGPMRLGDLAKHQRCVKSNVSYLARTMEREGLIELTVSEEDGRSRLITASPLGRRRYEKARAAAQKVEAALRRALGPQATDQLTRACLEAATTLDAM